MQEDQTTTQSQPTIAEVAERYAAGRRLTRQELAIIQDNRAATEEFMATVKRLVVEEAPLRSGL